MIEILSGRLGTLQAALGWLLVLYPILSLPLVLRAFLRVEQARQGSESQGSPAQAYPPAKTAEFSPRSRGQQPARRPKHEAVEPMVSLSQVFEILERVEDERAHYEAPDEWASGDVEDEEVWDDFQAWSEPAKNQPIQIRDWMAGPEGPEEEFVEPRSLRPRREMARPSRIQELRRAYQDRVRSRAPEAPTELPPRESRRARTERPAPRPKDRRKAAQRVARSPHMKSWIRDVAWDVLRSTGTEG